MNDFFDIDICCPSKSRVTFDEDELDSERKNNELLSANNNYVMIPNSNEILLDESGNHSNNSTRTNKVRKGENEHVVRVGGDEIQGLLDDIDAIADRIKEISDFTSKEEAELEKTLTILRSQLVPKRRKRKEAFKKFPFVIFSNPKTKGDTVTITTKPAPVHAAAVV